MIRKFDAKEIWRKRTATLHRYITQYYKRESSKEVVERDREIKREKPTRNYDDNDIRESQEWEAGGRDARVSCRAFILSSAKAKRQIARSRIPDDSTASSHTFAPSLTSPFFPRVSRFLSLFPSPSYVAPIVYIYRLPRLQSSYY